MARLVESLKTLRRQVDELVSAVCTPSSGRAHMCDTHGISNQLTSRAPRGCRLHRGAHAGSASRCRADRLFGVAPADQLGTEHKSGLGRSRPSRPLVDRGRFCTRWDRGSAAVLAWGAVQESAESAECPGLPRVDNPHLGGVGSRRQRQLQDDRAARILELDTGDRPRTPRECHPRRVHMRCDEQSSESTDPRASRRRCHIHWSGCHPPTANSHRGLDGHVLGIVSVCALSPILAGEEVI